MKVCLLVASEERINLKSDRYQQRVPRFFLFFLFFFFLEKIMFRCEGHYKLFICINVYTVFISTIGTKKAITYHKGFPV